MFAQLALLLLQSAIAPSPDTPVLTKAVFYSHTTDYAKNSNSALTVRVLLAHEDRAIASVLAADGTVAYAERTDHKVDLLLAPQPLTKAEAVGFRSSVVILPNGHDPWRMTATVVLSFSDNTTLSAETGEVLMSTDHPTVNLQANNLAALADQYAPQLMHPHDEPNLPANVGWFLPKTTLGFRNGSCPQDAKEFGQATFGSLREAKVSSKCGGHTYLASGTRNSNKSKTFVLSDVSNEYKGGSRNPSDWVTYYHGYRNDRGGWTIQYWTFYAFNTGTQIHIPLLPPVEVGYHGGDWEMVAVVLDSSDSPLSIITTGHTEMASVPWSAAAKIGNHPIVYTERGGHEAHTREVSGGPYLVHQTWRGSMVSGLGAALESAGPLVDLGSKLHPKTEFLLYSGLWGSLGATSISSGYWGPVFNETGMRADGFLTAWCTGVLDPNASEDGKHECFPDDSQ